MSLTFRHIALIGKHHSAFNSAPPAQARQVDRLHINLLK
jgi:hypothetical protein